MRVLGLDLGTKTLGIAISDKTNTLSTPVEVINFKKEDYASLIPTIEKLIKDKDITDIALGLPKNMDNTEGFAAERSRNFAKLLESLNVNIHFVDERLTTVSALNILKETGNKKIKEKNVVDAIAANIILESYLKGLKK